jgi:hypothetical protein
MKNESSWLEQVEFRTVYHGWLGQTKVTTSGPKQVHKQIFFQLAKPPGNRNGEEKDGAAMVVQVKFSSAQQSL